MIIVDSREQFKEKVVANLKKWGIDSKIVPLDSGDYVIPKLELAIERKSVIDLMGSLDRLPDQLRRCLNAYTNVMLIVEGKMYVDYASGTMLRFEGGVKRPTGVKYQALQSMLMGFALDHGIHLFYTQTLADTCLTLKTLHERGDKPIHKPLGYEPTVEFRVRGMYGLLPGIGPELAERLRIAFPTPPFRPGWVDEVRNMKVRGIGTERLKEIGAFLDGATTTDDVGVMVDGGETGGTDDGATDDAGEDA